jgi:putative SOS response-associated peptidase YedK
MEKCRIEEWELNHRGVEAVRTGKKDASWCPCAGASSRLVEEIGQGSAATFDARAESVAEKPMSRNAFKERRCIIPASGFYEWTGPKTARQPHLFAAADGAPVLAFAGLWDRSAQSPKRRRNCLLHHDCVGCQRLGGATTGFVIGMRPVL